MIIKIGKEHPVTVDTVGERVELEEVYCGLGIQTEQGHFSVCQRDHGIHVLLDGYIVFASCDNLPKTSSLD